MILSFDAKETEALCIAEKSRRSGHIARVALRTLLQLPASAPLAALSVPPLPHLHALSGTHRVHHSFRLTAPRLLFFVCTST